MENRKRGRGRGRGRGWSIGVTRGSVQGRIEEREREVMMIESGTAESCSDERERGREGRGRERGGLEGHIWRIHFCFGAAAPFAPTLDRGLIKDPDVLRRQNLCNFELCTGSESAPSSSPDLAEGEAALSHLNSCVSRSDTQVAGQSREASVIHPVFCLFIRIGAAAYGADHVKRLGY